MTNMIEAAQEKTGQRIYVEMEVKGKLFSYMNRTGQALAIGQSVVVPTNGKLGRGWEETKIIKIEELGE